MEATAAGAARAAVRRKVRAYLGFIDGEGNAGDGPDPLRGGGGRRRPAPGD